MGQEVEALQSQQPRHTEKGSLLEPQGQVLRPARIDDRPGRDKTLVVDWSKPTDSIELFSWK